MFNNEYSYFRNLKLLWTKFHRRGPDGNKMKMWGKNKFS